MIPQVHHRWIFPLALLGFVMLGLLRAASATWYGHRLPGLPAMSAAVLAMLISLIPLTRVWPAGWSGRWALVAAAIVAVVPVLVAVWVLSWTVAPGIERRRTARRQVLAT